MELSNFDFTTECKAASALGMDGYSFYYGSIDGVEVGDPCNTHAESLENLKDVLTREQPYLLEDLLLEHVRSHEKALNTCTVSNKKSLLKSRLEKHKALLIKVLAFKSNNNEITMKKWTVGTNTQPSNWDVENGFLWSAYWGDSERGSFKSSEDAQAFCDQKNADVDKKA
ncbi:hypothetical protein [Vibrio coralliilyticus]|uniref:Uncharacterized protein n=1 Tax=Vibrio coralliilyticus TaxID=190893 RepID=A0AAP6ZNE1_9VIBR|nr:hypothetical protein [Vibrio coralliilyticus]NOI32019.1 hypothetical protein [Vibrio coralliilyticus]NOJ25220.1 hypothetical protein [Vibrio coralliilyticus]